MKTNKTTYFFYFFLSLVFFVILTITSCKKAKHRFENKPNIILINVDDLGWTDVGFMGSTFYDTPNLDTLAKQGMVFTKAYAGAANCAPSRACLLSGLNTPRHGVFTVGSSERGDKRNRKLIPVKNKRYLHDTIYTLPEMLKSAGYVTANFGKWHVGLDPSTQGIDINVGGSGRGNPGKNGYFSPYRIDFITDGAPGEYLTDRLTNEAISFIKQNKDTSFFAYIPFYTVHTPIQGKKAWINRYEKKTGNINHNQPIYGAMVSAMDENIGKLMRTLKELSLTENTLVIFTSDNGGIRAISKQVPLRAGKGSYYEGGIRVPLVIRWPTKILSGTKNDNPVSHLDIYPTLQEIVKPAKSNTFLDGYSLLNQFTDLSRAPRDLYYHFPVYLQAYNKMLDGGRDPLFRTRPGSVIISGDWKLHHYYEDNQIELYNLNQDLSEKVNRTHNNIAKASELLHKLDAWRNRTLAPIPTKINSDYDFKKEN